MADAKLTVLIEDDLHHRAKRVALEERTTMSGLVRELLENYVTEREAVYNERASQRFAEMIRTLNPPEPEHTAEPVLGVPIMHPELKPDD